MLQRALSALITLGASFGSEEQKPKLAVAWRSSTAESAAELPMCTAPVLAVTVHESTWLALHTLKNLGYHEGLSEFRFEII